MCVTDGMPLRNSIGVAKGVSNGMPHCFTDGATLRKTIGVADCMPVRNTLGNTTGDTMSIANGVPLR